MLLDSAGIDYHVVLAQNALHQCLILSELQPELLCALIKQTSRIQSQCHSTKRGGAQVNRSGLHKISKPAKPTHVSGASAWPASFVLFCFVFVLFCFFVLFFSFFFFFSTCLAMIFRRVPKSYSSFSMIYQRFLF